MAAADTRTHVGTLQPELAERKARRGISATRKDAVIRIENLVGRAIFAADLQPAVVAKAELSRYIEPARPDIFVAAFILNRILAETQVAGCQRGPRNRAE